MSSSVAEMSVLESEICEPPDAHRVVINTSDQLRYALQPHLHPDLGDAASHLVLDLARVAVHEPQPQQPEGVLQQVGDRLVVAEGDRAAEAHNGLFVGGGIFTGQISNFMGTNCFIG